MLDVSLVVIGFIIVAISYFISEKIEQGVTSSDVPEALGQVREIWSQKDEEKVKEQIDTITARKMEEAENHVDDELSRISNEKIMAVDEFSNQILEKIEKNHKDVVFLYNMLNEKQEEIKKMITEADTTKTALEDSIRISRESMPKTYTAVDMLQKIAKEGKSKTEIHELEEQEKAALTAIFNETENEEAETDAVNKMEQIQKENSSLDEETEQLEKATVVQHQDGIEKLLGDSETAETDEEETNSGVPITKEQILELYKEGKSVLEISKLLHMGQGEVKLIIDLYQ